MGISKDVALVHFAGIYTGIGLGAYIKSKSRDDMRVNSAFTFGEKRFLAGTLGLFLQKLISGISRMDHLRIKIQGIIL
ncbi:outer membrane protein [Salmonella enterica subsp. enterica serovar Heidelberg str. 77-1831]|nr:outer membrane protein [Salmonella enterica subsp. enterica serovar Heidelberg str. 77-1831]